MVNQGVAQHSSAPSGTGASSFNSCSSPQGYALSYPDWWYAFEAAPPIDQEMRRVVGDDWKLSECALFGTAPVEIEWATEGVWGPITLGVQFGVNFAEATKAPGSEGAEPGETQRQEGEVGGHRAVRITSVSTNAVDGNEVAELPGGTRSVSWFVELPPDAEGNDRTFLARAVPYGVAKSGVTDNQRAAQNAMDVAEPAAVLDAMMQSVTFTEPTALASPSAAAPEAHSAEVISDTCLVKRAAPQTTAPQVGGCLQSGTRVAIECTIQGESVVGPDGATATWDRLQYPGEPGYVSDAWVSGSGAIIGEC